MKELKRTYKMITKNILDGSEKVYIFNKSLQCGYRDAFLYLNEKNVGYWDENFERIKLLQVYN